MKEYGGWVYILASKRNGTLYTGVTNDLIARVQAHKDGEPGLAMVKLLVGKTATQLKLSQYNPAREFTSHSARSKPSTRFWPCGNFWGHKRG